ncbi:hypothetical protein [Haloferula sp. A504]|uniref:hypothetical protein n=1 Tax=Haloferula sp. A504 TaxID=3373601 RepID=UPI0031BD242F|nr:hypothetical protein [Verrucomicrobiaceae bacterium E54]
MKIENLVVFFVAATFLIGRAAEEDGGFPKFDENLVLIKVLSVEPLSVEEAVARRLGRTSLMVHNGQGVVEEVYSGDRHLKGRVFRLTPPPYFPGNPARLTHTDVSFRGFAMKDELPVGAEIVLTVIPREDFDPSNRNFNPYNFPKFSCFYLLLEQPRMRVYGVRFPEILGRQKQWGEYVRSLTLIKDPEDLRMRVRQGIFSRNPLVAISSVHFLAKLDGTLLADFAREHRFSDKLSFHARLALDHEMILREGEKWNGDDHGRFLELLTEESKGVHNGDHFLIQRQRHIASGAWSKAEE